MKKPPYAFLFGKHPPPLELVKSTLLDAFCTDRGTLHASDLPELDLDREWWCVTRSAFSRMFLAYCSSSHRAAAVDAMLRVFLPFFRPKRSEYWRRFTIVRADDNDGPAADSDTAAEPPPNFTYTDFHRFLRQLTEPHGLLWIKTINYLGTQEYPAFYVGFPSASNTKEDE